MSRRNGKNHRLLMGFTLVEILTVVAIIAVLAGLLMPGLAAARERARQSVCTSNLRQVGHAVMMYLDDYKARPPRLQTLVEARYVTTSRVLVCPDDPMGNWGGTYYDKERRPEMAPESIHYSYFHPFSWPDWEWNELVKSRSAGIAACQLHGARTDRLSQSSILNYEGLVLRLQLDGAVVRRRIKWERTPNRLVVADPWRFCSDDPPASRKLRRNASS
jgi:prepilin-type N-terminal cleavage/methylation domain-containing protein